MSEPYQLEPYPEDDSDECIFKRTDGSHTLFSGETFPRHWAEVIILLINAAYREGYVDCDRGIKLRPSLPARAFTVGVETSPNEFGMIAGPFLTEKQALEITGQPDARVLLCHRNGTHEVLWKWKNDKWER